MHRESRLDYVEGDELPLRYELPRKRKPRDAQHELRKRSRAQTHTAAAAAEAGGSISRTLAFDLRSLTSIASAPYSPEMRVFSEELAQTVLTTESLMKSLSGTIDSSTFVDTARVAWRAAGRLRRYTLDKRPALDNEHRIAVWVTRLRCVALASCRCFEEFMDKHPKQAPVSSSSSSSSSSGYMTKKLRQARNDSMSKFDNTGIDRELFAAHAVFWPYDTEQGGVYQWCAKRRLLLPHMHNIDADLRLCSMSVLWKLITALLHRWNELNYCAQLVAYVWRLKERVADFCTYTGTIREFNHPLYSKAIDGTRREYSVNDVFLRETERTFYYIELYLKRCSFLHWPNLSSKTAPRVRLRADAVQRFEQFIKAELDSERFTKYIEKDFRVLLYDFLLHPGEMERFELTRPYDDRKPLTCVSKMRTNDFDRYQRLFAEPDIHVVWKYLVDNNMRTHPAYTLLASRVMQFYFDSAFEGASFDAYFCDISILPLEALRQNGASSTMRDHTGVRAAALTRGSAEHVLGGTLLKKGMECTPESQMPHPLIVNSLGLPSLVINDESCVVHVDGAEHCFASVFLAWLYSFCADSRLMGTFINGECCAPLLAELAPTRDSERVAQRCARGREKLRLKRSYITGLEDNVRQLRNVYRPKQSSDDKTLVIE